MTIKYIHIPADTDWKSYLREAEFAVDALSDEELESAEAEVEARIKALSNPPISIFSRSSAPTKNKTKSSSSWKKASFGGFLMAAMALLFVHNQSVNDQDHWQTKGLSDAVSPVCEISVVQNAEASVLNPNLGYLVSGEAFIYVKANCQPEVVIEHFQGGRWKPIEKAYLLDGFVQNDEGPVDFRKYRGMRLRLNTENGVSEEFSLTKTP